jgi:hypothetical protein
MDLIGRPSSAYDINVKDYGAIGNGSTDDTAALAAAAAAANALANTAIDSLAVNYYPRLIFPPALGYPTTATLNVKAGVEVHMYGPLLVTAGAGTPIIGMKYSDARGVNFQAPRWTESRFNIRRSTQSTWPGETDIGLQVEGHYVGKINLERITGFHVGCDMCAAYEYVSIGEIRDAKIGLLVRDRTSPTTQFTNQTRFVGGEFAASGTNAGTSRYGIVVRAVGGINSLVFEGQSYELGLATALPGEAIPMIFDGSAGGSNIVDCRALSQRSESNSVTFVRASGVVRNLEVGVINQNLEYTDASELLLDDQTAGTGRGNLYVYHHTAANAPGWGDFFNTGRLAEKAVQLTGGVITIQNFECATNVGAAPATQGFTYGNTGPAFDASGYMTCTGPLYGVRVRLNGARSIALSGRKGSGDTAAVSVLCYDSSGVQLYSAGLVQLEQSALSVNTGIYGGYYSAGINPTNTAKSFEAVLTFDSSVAVVFVTVTTRTDGWILRRNDPRPEWFSTTSHLQNQFVGAAVPIALANVAYKQGMRVAQITSAVGAPKGWVCTAPGVPTFVSEGNL